MVQVSWDVVSKINMPTKRFVTVDKQRSRQCGMLSLFYGCVPIGITCGLAKAGIWTSESQNEFIPARSHRCAFHLRITGMHVSGTNFTS